MFSTCVVRSIKMKKKPYEAEGAKPYREANKRIQKAVKKSEDWIGSQCEEIKTCLNKTIAKAYQLVNLRETG